MGPSRDLLVTCPFLMTARETITVKSDREHVTPLEAAVRGPAIVDLPLVGSRNVSTTRVSPRDNKCSLKAAHVRT